MLNDPEVLNEVYKEVDTSLLIESLGNVSTNILAIGRTKVWLINAATCHRGHFIGTELSIELKPPLRDHAKWKKLRDFIYRFVTPGATVYAFIFKGDRVPTHDCGKLIKLANSFSQLPECRIQPSNGIYTGQKAVIPITKDRINDDWVYGWTKFPERIREQFTMT